MVSPTTTRPQVIQSAFSIGIRPSCAAVGSPEGTEDDQLVVVTGHRMILSPRFDGRKKLGSDY